MDKQVFLRENMKYLCPTVLKGMIAEQTKLIQDVISKTATDSVDMAQASQLRAEKQKKLVELKTKLAEQQPLKWVDRVIMWCAEKMPSAFAGLDESNADACVKKGLEKMKRRKTC